MYLFVMSRVRLKLLPDQEVSCHSSDVVVFSHIVVTLENYLIKTKNKSLRLMRKKQELTGPLHHSHES